MASDVGIQPTPWFTRVECLTSGDSAQYMDESWSRLTRSMDGDPKISKLSLDQGTGMHDPVLGVCFVVVAGSGPDAARYAVDWVESALGDISDGLYGVTVIAPQGNLDEDEDDFPPLLD